MDRRGFLKRTAATAGLTVLPAAAVRGARANEKIRMGLIGCGGRGIWIGDLFEENANAKVVAVHDYFRDRVEMAGKKFGIDEKHQFVGLDGYRELIEDGVDAVAVESPPYFHPAQTVAALAAGKHVYLAKPIAVDVAGCNAIVEAAEQARGRCSVLVDFQTRNNEYFRGAAKRVHEGMIGAPVSGQFFYHTGRLGIKTPPGTETARLRNWAFDIPLSGDIIVEQNIHVLDVANWYLDGYPVEAWGAGGRKVRTDVGDTWDHYVVTYRYPNDVLVDFSSTQFIYGFNDLCMRLFGSEGTVESHYGGEVYIRGKKDGWKGGKTPSIYKDGAVNNIKDFCAGIEHGEFINNARDGADSTLTALLGRAAARADGPVSWEAMMAANEVLDPALDLPADGPDRRD